MHITSRIVVLPGSVGHLAKQELAKRLGPPVKCLDRRPQPAADRDGTCFVAAVAGAWGRGMAEDVPDMPEMVDMARTIPRRFRKRSNYNNWLSSLKRRVVSASALRS